MSYGKRYVAIFNGNLFRQSNYMTCPNFTICGKSMRPGLKVCSSCFWRFKNEVLEFKNDECSVCFEVTDCVKFRKCSHFVCLKCFKKLDKCTLCHQDEKNILLI